MSWGIVDEKLVALMAADTEAALRDWPALTPDDVAEMAARTEAAIAQLGAEADSVQAGPGN